MSELALDAASANNSAQARAENKTSFGEGRKFPIYDDHEMCRRTPWQCWLCLWSKRVLRSGGGNALGILTVQRRFLSPRMATRGIVVLALASLRCGFPLILSATGQVVG